MSDWPATSCSSAVPGPRRIQSLKGCMGALPQMFQWSRVLGSNNKCIATTADVQTECFATEKQTEIKRWANQVKPVVQLRRGQQLGLTGQAVAAVSNESAMGTTSSSVSGKEADRNQRGGIDLRQVLHAKQEPFVLQDVIREKRQPTRTHSSRELKFGAPSSRRSLKIKNSTSSKDQEQIAEDAGGSTARYCVPPKTPTGSAAVVRRNCKVPVESMVAMPSYQAPTTVYGVNSKKAHSKTASQGRNPVKSPNKRALLMEAAARILEGSNRRTSKRPSASVRSLLEELEKSRHVEELPKPKERLVRAVVLHSEMSEREEVSSPNVVILGEKAAQKKQHQNSYALNSLGRHNSNCARHPLQMPQILEKDILFMQNRVFPYENALGEAEVFPSLATAVQNPSEHDVQLHDEYLWSGMKETQNETMNQTLRGFKLDASDLLLQPKAMATVHPEVITTEDQHITELDHGALLKNSRAIALSAIDFPFIMGSTCLMRPNFDNGMSSPITRIVLDYSVARHFTWAAVPFPVNKPEKSERSSARSTVRSLIEGADETGHTYRARDMKASMEAERQSSVMQLRLCNYSWWAAANSHQNNSPEKCENQLSSEYGAGYESPVAARNPCFVKVWNAEREDFEQEACVCVDEFQQASPVSVLEPVYNEELEVGKSFDHFEETRQKLLEKVRRYEMLAHMDVDMLKKVSEEQVSYAWDDDDNESWETDDSCSSSSSVSSAQYTSDVKCGKRCEERYVEVYDVPQEVEMRSPTSFTRKLEPRPISCRVLLALDEGTEAPQQSQRLVIVDDPIKEGGARPSSSTIVAYMVNSLLHKDLTTSNWSSSKQEEELEVELESCFVDLLMCELLADLLFKPFCNAFDFNGKPVHDANCSQC